MCCTRMANPWGAMLMTRFTHPLDTDMVAHTTTVADLGLCLDSSHPGSAFNRSLSKMAYSRQYPKKSPFAPRGGLKWILMAFAGLFLSSCQHTPVPMSDVEVIEMQLLIDQVLDGRSVDEWREGQHPGLRIWEVEW